jgi:hypothetical protein
MHGAECRDAAEKCAPADAETGDHESSLDTNFVARILDGAPPLSKWDRGVSGWRDRLNTAAGHANLLQCVGFFISRGNACGVVVDA